MQIQNALRWIIGVWLPLCLVFMACSHTPDRRHPRYGELNSGIRTLLLLQPEVLIVKEHADGSRMLQTDESDAAWRHIRGAVIQRLAEEQVAIRVADATVTAMPETRSVQALFRAVNRSIQLHVYGPQPIPGKLQCFEYHLGDVKPVLAAAGADALVLTIAHQFASSRAPRTWIAIALVEPGGRILWYNTISADPTLELIDPQSVQALVQEALVRFGDPS